MSISVLMAVYDAEKPEYLDRAIQSIWSDQTVRPDQVIIVEDGPLTRELEAVINKWSLEIGLSLTLLKNDENIGLTKSLNRGIQAVTSTYIARMDSDDISIPQRFQWQKEFLDSHPEVAIIGGNLQEFDSTKDNLGVRHYPKTNEEVLSYIYKASPLAHPTVMMRSEIFDKGLHYNERYRTSQDIALWFDVLDAGYKIANLEEITIKFRREGDVFKRRSKQKAKNELKIYLNGIRKLYGHITWRYIYPISRFCFRMMPIPLVRYIYGSNIRKSFLK